MALTVSVEVPPRDREVLASWVRSPSIRAGLAQRARIVLLAADGIGTNEIVRRTGVSKPTVILWKKRYAAEGTGGLEDRPRPGKPRTTDDVAIVLATLEPPERLGVTHWSSRLLAAELGLSNVKVADVWREWGLQPWRAESFKFSTDPRLEAKVRDVAGLYLNPVGFRNSAIGPDLGIYAARSYSLMRPPRTDRRLIFSWERSATGWSGRGGRSCRLRLWVPRTSSTSGDQAVFVDHAADAKVSSDTVLLKIDRFGERFQRRSGIERSVRPVLIVMGLVLAQDPPQMVLIPDEGASRSSRRHPPIQRSAIAFMRGVRTLQSTVRIPVSARIASNAAV
jgi:transposase